MGQHAHQCFADTVLVPMQSSAGHVLQNSQDAGDWHEASVSFRLNYASLFLHDYPQLISPVYNILMTLDLGVHRYVFDGKPPALKKEELSRRWVLCMLLMMCGLSILCVLECSGGTNGGDSKESCCCRVERRGDATDQLTEAKEVGIPSVLFDKAQRQTAF